MARTRWSRACLPVTQRRYVRHDTNRGVIANFRSGLDQATGDYFMWLADDDWLDSDYVARCVDVLDDPAVVLANGDAIYYAGERPPVTEAGIDLTQASAARRVLGYYTQVVRNAAFYGLSRTEARRVVVLDNALGSDWVHVAELAALGAIRRAPVTIHRMDAGMSVDLDMGVARFTRPIAKLVAADVRDAVVYSDLGALRRRALALACAGVVYWRYGVLYVRDRFVGRVACRLRSRLRDDHYQRIRRAYHRLGGHRPFGDDHASHPDRPSPVPDPAGNGEGKLGSSE